MLPTYIVLLAIGLGIIWTGIKVCDQVYAIAVVVSGVILLIWGLAIAPLPMQLLIELLAIVLLRFLPKFPLKSRLIGNEARTQCLNDL
ncbi:MAG: hypothetical protein KME06_00760 [Kastovskya adunca ATA6-11-RM4]|jgi:hypothetical protein|nr:hypothetical protein [Kastovskya adunca ATA6-11-RM4]